MSKPADFSSARDPQNRSRKNCVCGGHSTKNKNAKRRGKWKPWQERAIGLADAFFGIFGMRREKRTGGNRR